MSLKIGGSKLTCVKRLTAAIRQIFKEHGVLPATAKLPETNSRKPPRQTLPHLPEKPKLEMQAKLILSMTRRVELMTYD